MTKFVVAQVLGACLVLAACDQSAGKPAEKAAEPAQAAPVAIVRADWSSLEGLVGKYPADSKLFEDSPIVPALKALLGDRFETFKFNTQTSGPLQKDGVLFVTGNKPHNGGSDQAYLLVDPATQAMEVGLWEAGKLSVFTTPGATLTKPKDVQTMLANAG
jgi:hypothetical protein